MGTVYRKSVTRPLPPGAEIVVRQGERLARWKTRAGKLRTASVTNTAEGVDRIRVEAGTFVAKYRDGSGLVVERTTGCTTEQGARSRLAEWEREAELIRAGLLTQQEARQAVFRGEPLQGHLADYQASLEAAGRTAGHVREMARVVGRIARECEWTTIGDIDRSDLERWLNGRRLAGASARTRNVDLARLSSFCTWCVKLGRLPSNPVAGTQRASESADRRRRRRALTEPELARLLEAARTRPRIDATTIHRGQRKGMATANVRPEVLEQLDRLGLERALIYKTLVLTGLRRGELASLTVGSLRLDANQPHIVLSAADAKNRTESALPIRADLANDLRAWLADRLQRLQGDASRAGRPIPASLPADDQLFVVPNQMIRVLDRDLAAAGIPKVDDRGWSVDVHALRHTFGTMLSRAGVPLRTAQACMRHSDPRLTANLYTDPRLLDIGGAVESLPVLSLEAPSVAPESGLATGTNDLRRSFVAPTVAPDVAPTRCNQGQTHGQADRKPDSGPIGGRQGKHRRNP